MRGKSLALLVLALGCGLVASLGITQVLAKRGDPSAPSDTTPVYVAKADIATGCSSTRTTSNSNNGPRIEFQPGP